MIQEIKTLEYDGTGNLLYKGSAPAGSLKSEPSWNIEKFIYNGEGNLTDVQATVGGLGDNVWDDRASLSYM